MDGQIKINEILDQALVLLKNGSSIIPVGKDKKPLIAWKEYQTRRATEKEVKDWFNIWPDANIGIVTGKLSDVAVIDIETGGSVEGLPDTLKAKTGNGGWHYYYQYSEGIENAARIRPLTDIRGEGGYVVAPPSITSYEKDGKKYGGVYEWLERKPLQPFPVLLFGAKLKSDWKEIIVNPIERGARNVSFTSIVGGLLAKFPQEDWETMVWPVVQNQNQFQKEPLSIKDLRTSFESIAGRERQKRSTGGQIKDIVSEVIGEEIEIKITLEKCVVHFKVKNIISSLMEANVITWIEKTNGLSDEINFRLKIKSDTNREQWARILSKAFDRKEDKEIYPWTIIIAKGVNIVDIEIKNKKQDFSTIEGEAKKCSWLLEPFIQEDQINTIFGLGSSGKTLLSLYFSKFVAQDKRMNTLFIDYEDTFGGWKNKIVKISPSAAMNVGSDNFIYFDSEQIPIADQVDKIKEVIKRRNIKLVVVDSASLATGDSTSEEKAAVRLISALKLLKSTILLIAHQRKNDGDRTPIGSIQYENQSRNVWNIKSAPDDNDFHVLHLACTHTKANNTFLRRDPIGYRIEYTEEDIEINPESAKSYFGDKFTIREQIKEILMNNPKIDYKDIASRLGKEISFIQVKLSQGKKAGLWENDENGLWFLKQII